MGFWSFMRDMFVFDWLFGHHKKGSCGEHQRGNNHYADHSYSDDYYSNGYGGYNSHNDYAQQDFDDDLDSGMFDDF